MITHKILSEKPALAVTVVEKEKETDTGELPAFMERCAEYVCRKFKNQWEYEQWLACLNIEKGDILCYSTIRNIRSESYVTLLLVQDVVQDYTDLEWNTNNQPKAFVLTTVYTHPTSYRPPTTKLEIVRGLRSITAEELDWLKNNAFIQDKIKQDAPTFVYRNQAV